MFHWILLGTVLLISYFQQKLILRNREKIINQSSIPEEQENYLKFMRISRDKFYQCLTVVSKNWRKQSSSCPIIGLYRDRNSNNLDNLFFILIMHEQMGNNISLIDQNEFLDKRINFIFQRLKYDLNLIDFSTVFFKEGDMEKIGKLLIQYDLLFNDNNPISNNVYEFKSCLNLLERLDVFLFDDGIMNLEKYCYVLNSVDRLSDNIINTNNIHPRVWGDQWWLVIDMAIIHQPKFLSEEQMSDMKNFLLSMKSILPCTGCKQNFINNLKDKDLYLTDDILRNRNELFLWATKLERKIQKEKEGTMFQSLKR
ncbi:hypothetical protein ABPG72_015447 [Tetrahymena utriculariae]